MNFEEELKKKAEGRQQFMHQGQLVYEWDQGLEDVNVYIKPPPFLVPKYRKQYEASLKPGQKLPKIEIAIGKTGLKVGMTGSPPFLDEEYAKEVNANESLWLIEDEEIQVILQKAFKGDTWTSVFKGHGQVDPIMQQEIQKKIMLERFQEEVRTRHNEESGFRLLQRHNEWHRARSEEVYGRHQPQVTRRGGKEASVTIHHRVNSN